MGTWWWSGALCAPPCRRISDGHKVSGFWVRMGKARHISFFQFFVGREASAGCERVLCYKLIESV